MTTIYFDSSALTKLLLREDGSQISTRLWNAADATASSRLAYPEVRAALAAACRSRRVDADGYLAARARWRRIWSSLRIVEPAPELLEAAGDLAESQALRGYDAVHLASALRLADGEVIMVAWDDRLRTAASKLGLVTAPAGNPDERSG